MCGISGIVAQNSKNYKPEIDAMVLSLKHRGPDQQNTLFLNGCVLGHDRLSIVDLSTGNQPMSSPQERYSITFNGEIYGYKSIRDSLASEYPFKTSSDTEVILALYNKYGSEMMKHLPGAFAFGIWDNENSELFCARDRFGEKPFYYAIGDKGEFIFASEIKAILATKLVRPILDRAAVAEYLKRLYVSPHKTVYKNIFTLAPAHCLKFKNGRAIIERYWDLPKTDESISISEAAAKFNFLLDNAVKKQLIADVPVGAFLSGGLDSGTIVSLASKYSPKIQTFSFGFGDSRNELPLAANVARMYGTKHTELMDENYDISELLLKMQGVYDEPFADSSNIPTYLLSKAAREYVTVILTGDGGDELLGGYRNWYRALYFMQNEKNPSILKMWFFRLVARTASALKLKSYNDFNSRYRGVGYKTKFKNIGEAHQSQNSCFSEAELGILDFKPADENLYEQIEWQNNVDDAMRMDILDYMPGDILTKIDRASLANSLELRAPFLDVDFANFCISLPYNLKITDSEDKYILRKVFSDRWPANIRNREKQGFGAPVRKWLELDSVRKLKKEFLDSKNKKIFEIVPFDQSRRFVEKNNYQTWTLLVLALWAESHDFILE